MTEEFDEDVVFEVCIAAGVLAKPVTDALSYPSSVGNLKCRPFH